MANRDDKRIPSIAPSKKLRLFANSLALEVKTINSLPLYVDTVI